MYVRRSRKVYILSVPLGGSHRGSSSPSDGQDHGQWTNRPDWTVVAQTFTARLLRRVTGSIGTR